MRFSEQQKAELLDKEEPQLEKHDLLALMISGFLTIGLPCLLLILLIVGVTALIFGL